MAQEFLSQNLESEVGQLNEKSDTRTEDQALCCRCNCWPCALPLEPIRSPNSWKKSRVWRVRILGRNPESEEFSSLLFTATSTVYSFALRFIFLQTYATSYSFYSSFTVHCKGERRKTWKKTIPPSLWFNKSIQKPQVWELSRLCPETSTKLCVQAVSNVALWTVTVSVLIYNIYENVCTLTN